MSSAPTPDEIARDARWLVQALDPEAGLARFIAMDAAAYRAAGFLDDRMLAEGRPAALIRWDDAENALAQDSRSDARWIFHIGHVGSTLISRLLGELPGLLAVREPRTLRDLTMILADQRPKFTATVRKLMARTFAADQIVCVKATSFVSEIAPELVGGDGRALFLYATPANYIGSILAGENSRKELAMLASSRRQRMANRVAALPEPASEAQLAATAWACEMTSLEAACDALGSAVHWLDFDRWLDAPAAGLAAIAEHLSLPASTDCIEDIVRGPILRRYSKAMDHDYSPALRRDLIAEASARYRADIDSAMTMLHRAAADSPLLDRALRRAAMER